ncbi:glucooligosaccharide oxidase [Rhypophila decipiens]|uniref:Glucooligosaccharide oxidase n=1 Tax=Rhypophila decipiens TaxID=261697 RepID=A0AAN6Y3I6_9PEZI|nr:glucooligosaccharide oxidase [Rhypophila decipiens]
MRYESLLSIALAGLVAANPLAKRAAIDDCLKSAGVPVDAQGSQEWKNDVNPFNQRLPYTPVAIAVPTSVQHIQGAVSCAAKVGIKVSPKSGGHSYASFGLGGENGHLVVELDRMYKVTLDSSTQIATVEAGARLGRVATQLYNQGRRAFSHGTCPGVGVAGHSLHGGFGFSSHTYGLAVDWIVGATVVLANGTVVETSKTQNPDLFWALRGAGSNFGIVASFKFNTFAAPSQVTAFQVNLPWNNANAIATGWAAMQDWLAAGMPKEMNMRVFGSGGQTQLQGLYHGNSNNLRTAIQPLLSKLGASLSNAQQYDWMGAFSYYTYGGQVDVTHPYNQVETFYSKSLVTKALPQKALQAVANYWIQQAKSNSRDWFIIIDLYGGKNSAITKVTDQDASYAHRGDFLFLYELYDRVRFGSYPSNGFSFLDGWVKSFTNNLDKSQWAMYINYADPTMNRTEATDVYYRQNLARLQQIKAQVDPNELFYYPQAVAPAK